MGDEIWEKIIAMSGKTLYTFKNLPFEYTVKGNEIFISRKTKSITRATVGQAYQKAVELKGEVPGPKKLGTFGASYLYPIFIELGIIKVQKTEE